MMLITFGDSPLDSVDLSDLTHREVYEMYFDAVDDYAAYIHDGLEEEAELQQNCADAIVDLSGEATRRGLLLRTLH